MHHVISFLLRIAYAAAFGFILVWHTEDIFKYIPQLLGGLLMLECVAQLLELFYLKTKTQVASGFFIVPCLILLYGLCLIFFCSIDIDANARVQEIFAPSAGMSWLTLEMQTGGVCCLAFIISEIVTSIVFFKPLYRPEAFAEERRKQKEAQKALEEQQARLAAEEAKKMQEISAQGDGSQRSQMQ